MELFSTNNDSNPFYDGGYSNNKTAPFKEPTLADWLNWFEYNIPPLLMSGILELEDKRRHHEIVKLFSVEDGK